jgi:hypothetical protein
VPRRRSDSTRRRTKAGRLDSPTAALGAGEAAGPAGGELRVSANRGHETARRMKAGLRTGPATRGCAYTPPTESGCFGPTVTTTGESPTPRASQVAICGSLANPVARPAFVIAHVCRRRARDGCLCPAAVAVASRNRAKIVTAPRQFQYSTTTAVMAAVGDHEPCQARGHDVSPAVQRPPRREARREGAANSGTEPRSGGRAAPWCGSAGGRRGSGRGARRRAPIASVPYWRIAGRENVGESAPRSS